MGWYRKEVCRWLKSNCTYFLVPRSDCEFKCQICSASSQSYIDTVNDSLEDTFREIDFLNLHSHSNEILEGGILLLYYPYCVFCYAPPDRERDKPME